MIRNPSPMCTRRHIQGLPHSKRFRNPASHVVSVLPLLFGELSVNGILGTLPVTRPFMPTRHGSTLLDSWRRTVKSRSWTRIHSSSALAGGEYI